MSNSPTPAGARRRVLVTGATRGIGRAIALDLSRDSHVIIGGRDATAVAECVAELPSAEGFVADLSDEASTTQAALSLSGIDAVVHSAGVAGSAVTQDLSRDQLRAMLEVNFIAVADLTRLLLPQLRASATGHVITINSGSGFVSGPAGTAYSGSKFALRAFTDALREEERGHVRVTSIHPGRTDSDMQRELQSAMGRDYNPSAFLRPETVATLVRTALETSPEAQLETLSVRPVRTT